MGSCHAASQPLHGRVVGDVWHKNVRGSAHMLRVPPGWAVDLSDLDLAERAGARLLCVFDAETHRGFWARLNVLRAVGVPVSRGFGEQIALPLNRWSSTRSGAEALQLQGPVPARAAQLLLFEGAV